MTTPALRSPLELAEEPPASCCSRRSTALPTDGSAPEWITLFRSRPVQTRDGRAFDVSAATLLRAFQKDGIDLPVDVKPRHDTAR